MRRFSTILAIAWTLALTSAAWACPFCKDAVASSDSQSAGGLPSGFNNSIYVMLGGMLCVLGMIAFTLVKAARGAAGVPRAFPVLQRKK